MSKNSERQFVDLLFRASNKYANWDPEVPVHVGDYGRITHGRPSWAFWRKGSGIFFKDGNIYTDGIADAYKIPQPEEHGADAIGGTTWITSKNARQAGSDIGIAGETPVFLQCKAKAAFEFNSGCGAILAMENDTITTISAPSKLSRLLYEKSIPKGSVIVSEVHRCASYARFLSTEKSSLVTLRLAAEPPIPNVVSGGVNFKWMHSAHAGNFKAKVDRNGKRNFYPLFRLVSLVDQGLATGFRGCERQEAPLPDAQPPWITKETPDEEEGRNGDWTDSDSSTS